MSRVGCPGPSAHQSPAPPISQSPNLLMSPFLLLTLTSLAAAQSLPLVVQTMDGAVSAKEIAGSVTLVATPDATLHLAANGFADLEKKIPMKEDSLFWIASMTKPVTGTAVMMMQDAGKLSVDDPVSKYLPEFKNLKDGSGKEVVVTLKQCLTHSSGLSEVTPQESGNITTLKDLMPLIVAKPVQFAPGSQWKYCQTGINTAARVVEVVSGQDFPAFLDEHLFAPLGMKDTTFYPTDAQARRIAVSYSRNAAGELEKAGLMSLGNAPLTSRERYPRANGGLFSTAADYAQFARMILRGGELDGKRYLSEKSVQQMTTVQSGDLVTGFTPGNGWGLGWCVVREPQGVSATLSPGTHGHGGAYGTQAWIDPVKKRIHLLMVQRANFPNSDGSEVRRVFHDAASR
jgi:CubicO group peptidase (beta-lactamase class C family)